MVDLSPEIAVRLDEELVGWLTTVTQTGQPQSSIVWFLRKDGELLIYSQKGARKLSNLRAHPKVAFNLRSDEHGDEYVTIEATATVEDSAPPAHEVPAYLAKYEGEIGRLGWTPPEFAGEYPVLIRLKVDRLRSE
ncbi:MAG TPA: TIGR03667 family PPOX class F420-dependent oxidoreductase [Acidimicrobiia bacterium]|jgi:PPOX class probable F420-dependent enzyme